jgi:hypothetical protein
MHDGWATLATVWAAYFAPSSAARNQRNAAILAFALSSIDQI